MNYSIATTVSYPGPSKNMSILSSCLWFHDGKNMRDSKFFQYDNSGTFEFGYNSVTSLYAAVMATNNARCVFLYLNVYLYNLYTIAVFWNHIYSKFCSKHHEKMSFESS